MFRAMRTEVADALRDALGRLDFPTDDLGIERPPAEVDGVLASSVAYRLASEVGASPATVAGRVAETVDPADCAYIATVQSPGPYVNFLPSDQYFEATLVAAQASEYGTLDDRKTSVVVEHTSANPTGPVHVGRARNPIW